MSWDKKVEVMTTKAQEQESDKAEALAQLRELFPPGSTATTVLRHVSASGMTRAISVVRNDEDVTWLLVRAGIGTFDRRWGGVKRGGCGMDMGFDLVYSMSRALYPDGFGCIGQGCPSNDHSNGDRNYRPDALYEHSHWHRDGGYAVSHRWL